MDEITKTVETLSGNLYEMTKVRLYVLLRVDSFIANADATYNYSTITIEHVLPQTPRANSEWLQWIPQETDRKDLVPKIRESCVAF